MRQLRLLVPILLLAAAAFLAGNASGSVGPTSLPAPTAASWKVCLDERTADYLTRDVAAWPGLEECFRQP